MCGQIETPMHYLTAKIQSKFKDGRVEIKFGLNLDIQNILKFSLKSDPNSAQIIYFVLP